MDEDVSKQENWSNWLWSKKKKNLKNKKSVFFKHNSFTFIKLFYVDGIPD